MSKQADNRASNGQFKKGNQVGNRWAKGESGNPKGRRNAYTDLIKDMSFTKANGKERREVILSKLFQLAERGDLRAIQFIIERLEGKAVERQVRTNKSEPIQVMVIDD
ncbi:MAG TPA: hypothetical protein DEG69_05400 [Flavobacteriaceae bacterium]|jgi:hypothetical protein|nr:hypothetical protein [Flavobacteriaceae bacterium]